VSRDFSLPYAASLSGTEFLLQKAEAAQQHPAVRMSKFGVLVMGPAGAGKVSFLVSGMDSHI
jgi:hypothetical protein